MRDSSVSALLELEKDNIAVLSLLKGLIVIFNRKYHSKVNKIKILVNS